MKIDIGLVPALTFQFVMNSTRLGLYETVDQLNWTRFSPTSPHSTVLCVFWGGACGVAGSAVGCPLYMIKTQIQAQSHGKFAVGFQHSHTGMTNALISTYREQGVRGLWRGFEGIRSFFEYEILNKKLNYLFSKRYYSKDSCRIRNSDDNIYNLQRFSFKI